MLKEMGEDAAFHVLNPVATLREVLRLRATNVRNVVTPVA